MGMAPVHVTQQNFRETVLQNGRPVLLDFWAPWCTRCTNLAPVMDGLAAALEDRLVLAKLNTDECPVLTQQFGIRTIPALILFHDGQRSEALVNPPSRDAILDFLEENGIMTE